MYQKIYNPQFITDPIANPTVKDIGRLVIDNVSGSVGVVTKGVGATAVLTSILNEGDLSKLLTETRTVTATGTIVLTKPQFGIFSVFVNTKPIGQPEAFAEFVGYSVSGDTITLGVQDYNGKTAIIKYLSNSK